MKASGVDGSFRTVPNVIRASVAARRGRSVRPVVTRVIREVADRRRAIAALAHGLRALRILAGIDADTRNELMDNAVRNQPVTAE